MMYYHNSLGVTGCSAVVTQNRNAWHFSGVSRSFAWVHGCLRCIACSWRALCYSWIYARNVLAFVNLILTGDNPHLWEFRLTFYMADRESLFNRL